MQDIKKREKKMQEKRLTTNFKDVLKELGSWFNLTFYNNQGFVSKYPPNTGRISKIVSPKDFLDSRNDLLKYGQSFLNKSFFDQMKSLFYKIPLSARFSLFENENCDYVEDVFGAKNSYLSFGVGSNSENVLYTFIAKDNCRNVFNSSEVVDGSENVYMTSGITSSFNVFYSRFITNSSDIWFSSNLIGCHECLFCDNLENQSYCIDNIQLSKEEYKDKKQKSLEKKEEFLEQYINLPKHGINFASKDIDGEFVVKSENIEQGYYVYQTKNGRNLFMVGGKEGNENMHDIVLGGTVQADNAYASTMFGVRTSNVYFSWHIASSSNIYYCISLENCAYCLGCIGLVNKQFCILNKQYSKEEWFKKANEIFSQMNKDGELGLFFPASMNPFYFNDTVAYLIDDSFTKEEVEAEGYLRRNEKIKVDIPEGADLIKSTDLDQHQGFNSEGNREINPEILKKVIVDEKGNYYRIVKMEYDFLMKHGLPLPEVHWLDRIKLGFKFK